MPETDRLVLELDPQTHEALRALCTYQTFNNKHGIKSVALRQLVQGLLELEKELGTKEVRSLILNGKLTVGARV